MKNYIKIENPEISIEPLYIVKNPRFNQYELLLKNSKAKSIRGIVDVVNNDFYIADAYFFVHTGIEDMIEFYWNKLNYDKCVFYTDNNNDIILSSEIISTAYNFHRIINRLNNRNIIYEKNPSNIFLENLYNKYKENEDDFDYFLKLNLDANFIFFNPNFKLKLSKGMNKEEFYEALDLQQEENIELLKKSIKFN